MAEKTAKRLRQLAHLEAGWRTLERYGLLRWLECALWSANFGRRKPDPAMLEHVLGELGVAARSALFVGDKLRTDVLAAQRAGMRSVHLRRRGGEHVRMVAAPQRLGGVDRM